MSAQDFRIRLNLDNAPDIATELGNMCAAWSALEFRLFVLFAIIGGMPSAIARATFYSHHTTRNRTQLIMRVAGMVFRDLPQAKRELELLDDLFGRIDKTAGKRNAYIHDPWAALNETTKEVAQLRFGGPGLVGKGRPIKKRDLTQLIARIEKHGAAVFDWHKRANPMLSALRKKLDNSLVLTLAFPKARSPRRNKTEEPPPQPQS